LETDNVAQKAITDTTPKLVAATTPSRLYDLDGTTVLATRPDGFTERVSPYAAGDQRAVYTKMGDNVRLVLVRPDTIKELPADPTGGNTAATYNEGLDDAAAAVAGIPRR
jgi:hypothetical protein